MALVAELLLSTSKLHLNQFYRSTTTVELVFDSKGKIIEHEGAGPKCKSNETEFINLFYTFSKDEDFVHEKDLASNNYLHRTNSWIFNYTFERIDNVIKLWIVLFALLGAFTWAASAMGFRFSIVGIIMFLLFSEPMKASKTFRINS